MRNSDSPVTQVDLQIEKQVATVTLSGVKGIQTLSSQTRQNLHVALDQLEKTPALRIVQFQGTGRTFIAGADIHEFQDLTESTAGKLVTDGQQLMTRIAELPCITIAAINGACAGGGWELALACDFRIAIEDAKIGLPETSLGLLPCWGGTVRMTQQFGSALANQLILTGELIKAKSAFKKGLLHDVCTADEFEEQLSNLKTTLFSRSPFAQKMARKVIVKTAAREHQASLGFSDERNAFLECVHSGQVAIGVEAFLDKKTPIWDQAAI